MTGKTDAGIKIMHDGGIATIPYNQLPPDVLKGLGITSTPAPDDEYKLPSPFKTSRASYEDAQLISVQPDGIRIRHRLGSTKVGYEELPESVVKDLGPFDSSKASAFRSAEVERNRQVLAAAREAVLDAQRAGIEADRKAVASLEQQKDELVKNPKLISPSVFVEISAYSQGGKSRDTDWATWWGSYSRTEVSKRTMYCTVASQTKGYQRVRLQCMFLTREVTGSKDLLYEIVVDDLVSLGPQAAKVVGASAEAEQSTDNYAALGLHFKEGVKYVGWCWRAVDGQNRVVAVYSSTPAYDKYGWSTPVEPPNF